MKEQNIEQLFKNSFSNFEADVNPNAWANISQGLQAPVPAQHSLNGSSAGNTTGMLGRMSTSKVISLIVITAAIVGIAIYFGTDKPSDNIAAVKNLPNQVQENSVAVTPSIEPVVLSHVNPEVIKNVPAEKHNATKATEPKSATPKSDVIISDKSKEKENIVNNATQNSAPQANVMHLEEKSAGQKSAAPDENSSNDNSAVMSQPNDAITTTSFPEDISLTEPSYSNIISTTETDSKDFKFFVPNVFSPNGDLVNEYFTPMGLNFKEYELSIYDRSGHEIFRSKDIANKWDGKLHDGTPAPIDVYVYVINVKDMNNVIHPYSGNIMLRR